MNRTEELGAAIEKAAGELPEGYQVQITVENGGYSVHLLDDDGLDICIDGCSMADEIDGSVNSAKHLSKQT